MGVPERPPLGYKLGDPVMSFFSDGSGPGRGLIGKHQEAEGLVAVCPQQINQDLWGELAGLWLGIHEKSDFSLQVMDLVPEIV